MNYYFHFNFYVLYRFYPNFQINDYYQFIIIKIKKTIILTVKIKSKTNKIIKNQHKKAIYNYYFM